jgi:3-deoxy-D-manno-octulosonic-acid transferase
MRFAYGILTYLLSPVYAIYWIFRGITNRSYWDRFGQRFGRGYPHLDVGCIWVHAVSVGEVQATVPLVRALEERFPDKRILVTTVTPTGAARVRQLYQGSVEHCYIPFETPRAVTRFFDAVKPEIALIMETEVWPNLYHECGQRDVPLVLVSARISPRSVNSYRRFLPLFRETLSYGIVIAAQSEADADRFRSLGAAPERTWVTGNIKFDIELSDSILQDGKAFREQNFGLRPVWIAASTHDREEEQVLAAHKIVQERYPDVLLVLVPRHPERFPNVASLLSRDGWNFTRRSDNELCTAEAAVFLVDTMGEVPLFYAASDIAFVGGTLVPVGGHNLLEPAALGCPVVTGPHLHNTLDIARMFDEVGASKTISDPHSLGSVILELLANPDQARKIGGRGKDLVQQNRGSLDRLMRLLKPLITVD